MKMTSEVMDSKHTTDGVEKLQELGLGFSKNIFKGIWVPLVTPFKNQRVDFPALQNLANSMISSGIHGLVACGTTGEALSLSENEQLDVLIAVKEVAGANYPVMMGINGQNTTSVINKVLSLNQFDLAGFLISAPYYVKPSQQGILMHFQNIASASAHPIILYNHPSRTGVNMEIATIASLAKNSRIVAIKESTPDIVQSQNISKHTKLKLFAGDDALLLQIMNTNGVGAISAAAHIRPDLYVKIYNLLTAGNHEEASWLFSKLLPLIQLLFMEPNPASVKALLAHQSMIKEELRLPMTTVTEEHRMKLIEALKLLNDVV